MTEPYNWETQIDWREWESQPMTWGDKLAFGFSWAIMGGTFLCCLYHVCQLFI